VPVHENSRKAYAELDPDSRQRAVLEVYANSAEPLSDRMVAEDLGFADMNKVRPRITELVDGGHLCELERKIRDTQTGRSVRLCVVAANAPVKKTGTATGDVLKGFMRK